MAQKMIRAAVRICDKRQDKTWVMPCHRHCDAFLILKEFGYNRDDYVILEQGFLDANDVFYDRYEARKNAIESGQIETSEYPELFSEDLW